MILSGSWHKVQGSITETLPVKVGLGWRLTGGIVKKWKPLLGDLKEAAPVSIPRSYDYRVEGAPSSYTHYGSCDASAWAYAAVIYLVIESDIKIETKYLVCKTRVAPLQSQTVPRLELLLAFLLSKLVTSVIDSLSSTLPQYSVRCYTDSLRFGGRRSESPLLAIQ